MVYADRIPPRDESVLRYLIERNAGEAPDEWAISFESGARWTRRDCLEMANRAAHDLRATGVRQGDRVAMFLPNGEDFLRVWWGLCVLGAVAVPINPVFQGAMLGRVLELSRPVAIVTDVDWKPRVDEVAAPELVVLTPADLVSTDVSTPTLERPVEPWDTSALILTSGTTGPSKLVAVTYMYYAVGASSFFAVEELGRDDVFLADLPMFHMSALCYIGGAQITRTRLALRDRPNLGRYWDVARETGATASILLSSMVPVLMSTPPSAADRDHSMRTVLMSPLPADPDGFMQRFGITTAVTTFGMTEAPSIIRGRGRDAGSDQRGYCGRPYPGYEVRLVDEHDVEVAPGSAGELVCRTAAPWIITPEYFGDPEGTAKAWRNGWFHTGDLMRQDESGALYFVDRAKDALRRRGENVSAFEVERIVLSFDGVQEAACVAYPSDGGVDDEVKVWLITEGDQDIDFELILRHCHANLPYFMVPRYFEVADEFPKTPTLRVQKNVLRARGNGELTWDREAHGLSVTRHGLGVTA